jgi:membrane-associated HD superfamily phosphohydrolase
MKIVPIVSLIILIAFVFSCKPQKSENELLEEKVIQVHDEVMPKIGNLKSQKNKLEKKAESLKESASSDDDQKQIKELSAAAADCEQAYDDMFIWMRQFKKDTEGMTEEEEKVYFQNELEKVEKVKKDILQALENGEALL